MNKEEYEELKQVEQSDRLRTYQLVKAVDYLRTMARENGWPLNVLETALQAVCDKWIEQP